MIADQEKKDESNLLIAIAPILEDFIAELIQHPRQKSRRNCNSPIMNLGRSLPPPSALFVQRAHAAKYSKPADLPNLKWRGSLRAQLNSINVILRAGGDPESHILSEQIALGRG